MDTSDFPLHQCLLGRQFVLPTEDGGKNAIAVKKSLELMLVSIYTILVGGAFMAWWIIIAASIRRLIPKTLANNAAIKLASSWEVSEPAQTTFLMGKYCWGILAAKFARFRSKSTTGKPSPGAESWSALFCGFIIMLLGIGAIVGGILAGTYLPEKMVLGNLAPVNDTLVYFPLYSPSGILNDLPYNKPAMRAMSTVDLSLLSTELEELVTVEKIDTGLYGPDGETDYNITYSFSIKDYEWGTVAPLSLEVQGNCSFEYSWFNSTADYPEASWASDNYFFYSPDGIQTNYVEIVVKRLYDHGEYVIASQYATPSSRDYHNAILNHTDIGPHHYYIFSGTPFNVLQGSSTDPWYLTDRDDSLTHQPRYSVARRRPGLHCVEKVSWYHQNVYIGDRHSWGQEIVRPAPDGVPEGIWTILAADTERPLAVGLLVNTKFGKLESTVRGTTPLDNLGQVSGTDVSAYLDFKRITNASYLLARNKLTEAARMYFDIGLSEYARINNNALQPNGSGIPLPGTGDFVLPSKSVSALRMEVLVAVPAVVGFSWLVVLILLCLERKKQVPKICQLCGGSCSKVSLQDDDSSIGGKHTANV